MADLRFERTEQMLQQSFLKLLETTPFHDISIAKLAKKSLIDRTTFYAHYENIYELAEKLIDQYLEHFADAFEQNIKKREQEKKFDSYSFFDEELTAYLIGNRKKIMLVRALNLGMNSFDAKLRSLFKREYAKTLNVSENAFTIYLVVNLAMSNIDFILEKQRVPSKKELKKGLIKIEEFLS
ncbi:TetR/AcrR family transcriptional regulator [Blautia liquoris]|uniref:TetR/AcrR family transcriptional regulator n=1 Tax=Blautia liquoris TaxID=2779518 RepID=A0A7M2RJY1_9FIRM|nr:TetR/AcrR family transcriptional regulator [Blautia liquoris]QOV20304.1 TetR/AcrR family transcriptional regulator [Blautia liquoris]